MTIAPETSNGEHKVKISGIMISDQAGSAREWEKRLEGKGGEEGWGRDQHVSGKGGLEGGQGRAMSAKRERGKLIRLAE